jgi:uncharacterized protein
MSSHAKFPFTSVILTGGSSGIGKSFITHIGKLAPQVAVCNLSRRKPEVNVAQLKLRHLEVDLGDSEARRHAIGAAIAWVEKEAPTGRVLLVNNAGFGHYGEFPAGGIDKQLQILEVNLAAVLDLTAHCLPLLQARGGTLLNVASVTAFQPTPFIATYGATKAFLLHWGYALNQELQHSGVNVLTVCPGSTKTAFHQTAGMQVSGAASRFEQTSDEVVAAALTALRRGRPHVVTGWSNRLMTTFSRHLPLGLAARLSGRVLAHLRREKSAR